MAKARAAFTLLSHCIKCLWKHHNQLKWGGAVAGSLPLWSPLVFACWGLWDASHACLVSLPLPIANFLSINYKDQSSPCGVWNREWGLTLEQRLSNSPIHSVHLRPRTRTAKCFPPLSGKSLAKLEWLKHSLQVLKIKGGSSRRSILNGPKDLFLGYLKRGVKLSQPPEFKANVLVFLPWMIKPLS